MDGPHMHCVSCINQRCSVKPQAGIACSLMACPLTCGAIYHSCKTEEHHLLCPWERVPCLNSGYGCPATLVRHRMSAHLEVCPAGVVCCTMEWNRWPVSCLDYTSYESLSRGVEEAEQLDMALALQDQRTLLESLKVVSMTPTAGREPIITESMEDGQADSTLPTASLSTSTSEQFAQSSTLAGSPRPLPDSAKEKIANGINGLNEEHYGKLYEATVETARSLAAALDVFSSVGASKEVKGLDCPNRYEESRNGSVAKAPVPAEATEMHELDNPNLSPACMSEKLAENATGLQSSGTTNGQQPGKEEGVSRVGCSLDSEADMRPDVAHEASGAQPSSPLEPPLPVQEGVALQAGHVISDYRRTVLLDRQHERRLHNLPWGRAAGQFVPARGKRRDQAALMSQPQMESKAVDTSDLDQEEDPLGLGEIDLITAALFFCLEESRVCRRVSDTVYINGSHVDFGTQTFNFPPALLVTGTRVGDMASASACDHATPTLSYPSPFRTLRLGLVLETFEFDAVPHNRYLPQNARYQHMFPFVCGQVFRRDQFSSHFTNVHGDIHAGLNGWMEHRCPLAYYGCTFTQRRFYPSTRGAEVIHDRHLRSFGVQPCPGLQPQSASQADQLSVLPIEVLWHITTFLDSFSLCQLSRVCRSMRDLCSSQLQARGIVELQWERRLRPRSHASVTWQVKAKVWRFSTAFSPVRSWHFCEVPSMSDHLRHCRYNTVERRSEPVALPAMSSVCNGHSLRQVLRHIRSDITSCQAAEP